MYIMPFWLDLKSGGFFALTAVVEKKRKFQFPPYNHFSPVNTQQLENLLATCKFLDKASQPLYQRHS